MLFHILNQNKGKHYTSFYCMFEEQMGNVDTKSEFFVFALKLYSIMNILYKKQTLGKNECELILPSIILFA